MASTVSNVCRDFVISNQIIVKRYSQHFPSYLRRCFTTSPRRLTHGVSYKHQLGEQPLVYKTIGGCMQQAADRWPDRTWLVDCQQDDRLTFSQVLEQADRLAAGLAQMGLRQGDRLGICSPNSARWIVATVAAARAGLVMVAINPAYQQKELEYCLKKVGVKCLMMPSSFKNQQYYDMIVGLVPELRTCNSGELNSRDFPDFKVLVTMDDQKLPGTFTYSEVQSMASPASVQGISHLQASVRADDGCNIQFTSGTTGQPKGALLSHFNTVNNSFLVGKRNELSDKHHTICTQVPLFHVFGFVIVTLAALQHGATMVLPSASYSPEKTIKATIKEKCTILTGTPTMYVDLVTKQRQMGTSLTTPELAVTGGAPCSPQLFNHIKDILGVNTIKSVFGMTENAAVTFQSLPRETEDQVTQTVGHVQEHTEVKVVDSSGTVVPFGIPGELYVRGYCNMLGYWGDPEKTNETMDSDRWLKTGDQFVLQEDGYGKVVGRLKDVIIRGGENVFPKEIEDFLNAHPDVLESHVFGVKDDRLGEEICATIKLQPGAELGADRLHKYCKGKIAHFKVPRLVKIVDDFPKTASGKIQKFKLREMVESGHI